MAKKLGIDKIDLDKIDGKDVVYEIFHSMVREVRDEVSEQFNPHYFSFFILLPKLFFCIRICIPVDHVAVSLFEELYSKLYAP